jgi:hypothetical protein
MMKMRWICLSLILTACAPSARDGAARDAGSPIAGPIPPVQQESDSAKVARLERESRALVHADGCTASQCRTAPLGSRPCGGPREYLVYCAATTDSAALFAKLAELARAEEAWNQARGLASTCEYRMPPGTAVQGGRCVAVPAGLP